MSRILTRFHWQPHEERPYIERSQDATPIAEHARALRELPQGREVRLAAEYPKIVIEIYCNRNGVDYREFVCNPEHLKRLLRDPALKGFRVWEGNCGT